MKPTIGVLITSYNDLADILNRGLASVYQQDYPALVMVCVDDGSQTPVAEVIDFPYAPERLQVVRIPHGERAIARTAGIRRLQELQVDYMLFIDSDMMMPEHFFTNLIRYAGSHDADGYIIPEQAFSSYTNFWTKVKVFERNLYQAGSGTHATSIEAARFWKMSRFPGFDDGMNAFEEIQPTLACMRNGGIIRKAPTYLRHDERRVTLTNLLKKKSYYFQDMSGQSQSKLKDMVKRYYFFRIQLYHPTNLKQYARHPILTMSVVLLYLMLTGSAITNRIARQRGK